METRKRCLIEPLLIVSSDRHRFGLEASAGTPVRPVKLCGAMFVAFNRRCTAPRPERTSRCCALSSLSFSTSPYLYLHSLSLSAYIYAIYLAPEQFAAA